MSWRRPDRRHRDLDQHQPNGIIFQQLPTSARFRIPNPFFFLLRILGNAHKLLAVHGLKKQQHSFDSEGGGHSSGSPKTSGKWNKQGG